MSTRDFTRGFTAETGTTSAKAIERLRLEVSRDRIESGSEPIDQAALLTGFGDAERMRRAFIRYPRLRPAAEGATPRDEGKYRWHVSVT
jgi:transcriptional regulator GlxA family with amidase domain